MKCLKVEFKHEELDKNNICYIGKKNNQKIDFIVYGDSHILPYYKIFDKYLINNNKKGIFIGHNGCPPIPNIFTIRSDQSSKKCRKLTNLHNF